MEDFIIRESEPNNLTFSVLGEIFSYQRCGQNWYLLLKCYFEINRSVKYYRCHYKMQISLQSGLDIEVSAGFFLNLLLYKHW